MINETAEVKSPSSVEHDLVAAPLFASIAHTILWGIVGVPFCEAASGELLSFNSESTTLKDIVVYCGNAFEPVTAALIVGKLIQVLEDIHTKGVIHGNLKLDNICYNRSARQLELRDFSAAKFHKDVVCDSFKGETNQLEFGEGYLCVSLLLC